jgi:hypothetical protein
MKRFLLAVSLGASLWSASTFAEQATPTSAPKTKAVDFTGTEALSILGISAFKCEVRFGRPQILAKVTMVVGRTEAGKAIEEETLVIEMGRGFPPITKSTVGMAIRSDSDRLILIHDSMMMDKTIPAGFRLDYAAYAPDGIYDDGLVIFAYEARDKTKRPTKRTECVRYLGMRFSFRD